jgi:hypothetical protein
LRLSNIPLCVYTTFCLFIPLFLDLGHVHILAIVSNSAIKPLCIRIWVSVSNSFGYVSRCGMASFYGNAMFNFIRNQYTVFHSGYIILHSR